MTADRANAAGAVGILGGGQLALMLGEAARRLGLRCIALTDDSAPPARASCEIRTASPGDRSALRSFLSEAQAVAFENEFVDCDLLFAASEGHSVRLFPRLEAIRELQDKLRQKNLLDRAGIPSPRHVVLSRDQDPERLLRDFGGACVLKWARLGYDGKGVFSLAPEKLAAFPEFLAEASKRSSPVYAEERVDFLRELAIIGCRSVRGEFVSYPLVVSEQQDGICKRVYGPATSLGADAGLERLAQDYARKVAESADLVGSFALELFETRDGRLLVNEIAPRVHNSGHYTQDACRVSQFENHWRAILGMPLGETHASRAFAMQNLLGPPGVSTRSEDSMAPGSEPARGVFTHWYHKAEIRPRRKVGHLNGVADSVEKLPALLDELASRDRTWQERVSHGDTER